MNRFSIEPSVSVQRSKFSRRFSVHVPFDTGRLIPLWFDEVLPGDSIISPPRFLLRSLPASAPVMDNAFMTLEYYWVPMRLVWEHWNNFCGENDKTAWANNYEYTIPSCSGQSIDRIVGSNLDATNPASHYGRSLFDYLGVPASLVQDLFSDSSSRIRLGKALMASVSDLPFRAYALIWNEYYRDQNYEDPVLFSVGDNGTSYGVMDYTDEPFKVNKFHDYFTSVLPAPQKGEAVTIGVGGTAPIEVDFPNYFAVGIPQASLTFAGISGVDNKLLGIDPTNNHLVYHTFTTEHNPNVGDYSAVATAGTEPTVAISGNLTTDISPLEGTVDLDSATSVAINSLRAAFQMQRFLERSARYGTRYPEYLYSQYGVVSPQSVLQRPELIASFTVPINMDTVVSNSATADQPLGSMAGYSKTGGELSRVTKSFTEHGLIFCMCCVRTEHSYSQGIEKKWTRKKLFDFYHPVFAHLGEQAVKTSEINMAVLGTEDQDHVFGYQEAYAEYRYAANRLVGLMSPAYKNSLDMYTYGDNFDKSLRSANPDFLFETKDNVARTLADTSAPQWLGDFYFDNVWIRPMPMYSTPGLIDHF